MRVLLAIVVLGALAPAASAAELMVVGRSGTLLAPVTAATGAQHARVGGHRCTIGARTPLAMLEATSLKVRLRDYGACSKRARDAASLYVAAVSGQAEHGRDGWVYKVGNRSPSTGAGDLASRTRGRVTWLWCRMGTSGCQRTLAVKATASDGGVRAVVTAYDDDGKGVPAAGATVTAGDVTATADADGVATLATGPGTLDVVATQAKRVRSFAVKVTA